MRTEPDHLSQVSTNNLLENVTRYVIPEARANIVYSIVSAKRDAFRDASSICKTRVTSVTVMDMPYLVSWIHTAIVSVFHPFPSPPTLCFPSLRLSGRGKKKLSRGV